MKLKASVKAIYPDASLILFCIGILAACPLRIYQILKLIDPSTGFYSDPSHWSVLALYCILGLCTLIVFIFSFLSKNTPSSVLPIGRKIPLAISSVILSATFISDIINQINNIKSTQDLFIDNGQISSTTSSVACTIQLIFAALSCIYMLIFAISFFIERNIYSKVRVLALSPVIWVIVRIFTRITKKISFVQVSDLFFELIGLAFMMIFFFTFARIASQVNAEDSMWRIFACGITTALFVITYSLPRLMLVITNNASLVTADNPLELCDLGVAIFIIVFIITVLRSGYSVNDADRLIRVITPDMEIKPADTNEEKEEIEETTEELKTEE